MKILAAYGLKMANLHHHFRLSLNMYIHGKVESNLEGSWGEFLGSCIGLAIHSQFVVSTAFLSSTLYTGET